MVSKSPIRPLLGGEAPYRTAVGPRLSALLRSLADAILSDRSVEASAIVSGTLIHPLQRHVCGLRCFAPSPRVSS